jgi:ribonucleotide reductase alpha subunit
MSSSSTESLVSPPGELSELVPSGSTLETLLAAYDAIDDTASSTESREYVTRFREQALRTLMNDYFVERPKFNDERFRERFRMNKRLFLRVVADVEANFEWFQEGLDARGKKSFTALQKCTSAIRQLATGEPPDRFDDYLNMARRTSGEIFFKLIVINFFIF